MPNFPDGVPPIRRAAPPSGPMIVRDLHRYATLNGDLLVAVTNAAGGNLVLSAPDTLRNFLMIRNSSATANIYISFGNNASLSSVLMLAAGTIILFDTVVPQDDVYALADAAAGFVTVAQSVIPD